MLFESPIYLVYGYIILFLGINALPIKLESTFNPMLLTVFNWYCN